MYLPAFPAFASHFCRLMHAYDSTDFIQTPGELAVPYAQKRLFVSRRGIRFPYGSSDFCSFGIRPGKPPFYATIRTFCAPGTRFWSKAQKTRLAANFPVSGASHNFIDFHFSRPFRNF
jgi:hypothetical protein